MRQRSQRRPADFALLESQVEAAFSLVEAAGVESRAGKSSNAAELIAKATATHHTVAKNLRTAPDGAAEARTELWISARKLLEAIRAAERQRRQSGLSTTETTVRFEGEASGF